MIFDRLARQTGFDRVDTSTIAPRMVGLPPGGVHVDEKTALGLDAVFACVKIISETVMRLPWHVFRREGEARVYVPEHPANLLLGRHPNPEMEPYLFITEALMHLLLQGNFYAEIERNRVGQPVALWPFDSQRVTLERDTDDRLFYKIRNDRGADTELPPEDMFHVRGLTYNGLTGLSVIAYARETFSAAMAARRYGATFFGNGAIPGGIIQHQPESKLKGFDEEGLKNFYESWEQRLKGPDRANKVMYIDPGLTYQKIGVAPDDAQFIETIQASVPQICRWFGVQPHKVFDLLRSTNNNIEHQSKEFADSGVLPWVERFEQTANSKLLEPPYYSKMSIRALLRGDMVAQSTFYREMWGVGALTTNDILRLEDMNPTGPEGDKRAVPMNMTTLERLGESDDESTLGN